MKTITILIVNPKTKLCKMITPINYTKKDLVKTFKFYKNAGYQIRIV